MYIINKKPKDINNFKYNSYYFRRGRDAFSFILNLNFKNRKILIPAYIGYSTKEGSGVFDPIEHVGIDYEFYRFKKNLEIDKKFLINLMNKNPESVLLLIHYFGFKDKNINEIKKYALASKITIIEDFAHAFFTFHLNPKIDFDYAFFSLHKMFPFNSGGLLISKNILNYKDSCCYNPFDYNIYEIIQKRINNYNFLCKQLLEINEIKILKKNVNDQVPQTFPILLPSEDIRNYLYFHLNECGFGVVSLYHTLIKEISKKYITEQNISKHILNLPIHQDANLEDLKKLLDEIKLILKKK
jgi:dTDP-4-amino-4,6-dideoxygalactose transaminase